MMTDEEFYKRVSAWLIWKLAEGESVTITRADLLSCHLKFPQPTIVAEMCAGEAEVLTVKLMSEQEAIATEEAERILDHCRMKGHG